MLLGINRNENERKDLKKLAIVMSFNNILTSSIFLSVLLLRRELV